MAVLCIYCLPNPDFSSRLAIALAFPDGLPLGLIIFNSTSACEFFFFHILLQIIQPLQQGDLTAYPPVVESPRHWVVREGEMGSKLRPKAAAAFQASVGFPGQMFLSVLSAFGQFPEL